MQFYLQLTFTVIFIWYGILFLRGYWHEEYKEKFSIFRRYSTSIDPDKMFVTSIDTDVILSADLLAFWICVSLGILILINCLAIRYLGMNLDFTVFFSFVGLIIVWIVRFVFIYFYRNKRNVPKFWPGKRF